jgi:LPS sulfotransferase NodH
MKILILGTPRSGSTSLVKFIDSHIKSSNYKMFIEPYNQTLYEKREYDQDRDTILLLTKFDNILVKNLFLLGHEEYPIKSFNDIYKYLEWCYSYFDKIIILDRRDKLAQSESFTVNETVFREKGIGWHIQKIYDLDKIDKSYLNNMIDRYTESSNILKSISTINNFPIFYYEDIFLEHNIEVINNLLDYLEIELDIEKYNEFILSEYRKVRIEKSNKKLL